MTHVFEWPRRGAYVDWGKDLRVSDGETVAVSEDDPYRDHMEARGFVPADDVDPSDADFSVGDPVPVEASSPDSGPGGSTPENGEDRDGHMDYDTFADMGYTDRVDAVEAGRVDHLLDRIEAEDQSQNVLDAVEARRNGGE